MLCLLVGQYITRSKLGRILIAMRTKGGSRSLLRYSVAGFQVFSFCVAAMFAAIGGAMFTLQVGFMSPSFVGIVPSIEMVIYTAVGGRYSLFRRDLRHAARQLREVGLLGGLPAALAARSRRALHGGCPVLPERARGCLPKPGRRPPAEGTRRACREGPQRRPSDPGGVRTI